uniref:Phospholipase A2-like central domain-containing protein n=1 Tax=Vombatus ursinus TaxID=29139 RepID=A0A4X2LLB6_VOMUR
ATSWLLFTILVGHKQRHFHYILGKSHVHRRRFLELAGAGSCTTSPSALAYMIYGCSCGIGGTDWPPDKTDCKVEEAGCSPKMECYNWECRDQRVECGTNLNKFVTRSKLIHLFYRIAIIFILLQVPNYKLFFF